MQRSEPRIPKNSRSRERRTKGSPQGRLESGMHGRIIHVSKGVGRQRHPHENAGVILPQIAEMAGG